MRLGFTKKQLLAAFPYAGSEVWDILKDENLTEGAQQGIINDCLLKGREQLGIEENLMDFGGTMAKFIDWPGGNYDLPTIIWDYRTDSVKLQSYDKWYNSLPAKFRNG